MDNRDRESLQGEENISPVQDTTKSSNEDPAHLVRTEMLQGRLPGDQRVRRIYPAHSSLRRVDPGVLEATPETEIPHGGLGRLSYNVKRLLIGAPLATVQLENERLTRFKALAVLSSDAISSVAYATEASLLTLIMVNGSQNLWVELPIGVAIVLLLAIVALSYRQTIPAYPGGGGSYIVAKDNLGQLPGLIAAASLLIDYVLTVSVSISSGVLNFVSLPYFGGLTPYIVAIDVALVVLVTVVNLRGVRESATIFSLPTYLFIGSALLLILVGCIKSFFVAHHPLIGRFHYIAATEPLTAFLVLRSFADGCSAMTGVEAISNGIPAFKKPETRNAAATLTWMAVILGTLLMGITVLALTYGAESHVNGYPSVLAQIATQVFNGPLFFMFPVFQISTLLILVLAANTSYSDFPRLASILARDNFLPHQFAFRGDRLAFSIGIVFLAVLAIILLIAFQGDTSSLISLYAIGVFMSFTLSQGGMVLHWWRLRREHRGWLRSLIINGVGAFTTLVVAIVIASAKFTSGAWIVVILIPLLVLMFEGIHRHYKRVERERTTDIPVRPSNIRHRLIVPIASLDTIAKQALSYARSVSEHTTAIHVSSHKNRSDALRVEWQEWQQQLAADEKMQLEILDLNHRSISGRLLSYILNAHREFPDDTLTVVLPEVAIDHWLDYFVRNRTAIQLKAALLFRPGIVVTDLSPYQQQPGSSTPQRVENASIPLHPDQVKHLFIVPIAALDRVSRESLAYARSISNFVIAVHVSTEKQDEEKLRSDWEQWKKKLNPDDRTELVVIESPYRSLSRPLLNYVDTIHELYPDYALTVILPEFVVAHWWEHPLHNQTALHLKASLLFRPGIIVTSIPQHLPGRRQENRQALEPLVPM